MTLWPLLGALGVTLVALLLERVLRLLQLLSDSSDRFGFVAELAANLVPHYLGLTLPTAFFIALFMVVSRLNEGSEIDALLASGVSLSRLAAPYLALAAVLTLISLVLFGFVQPYSRYTYRAVLHQAQSAGWNGLVQARTFLSPDPSLTLTADNVDATGQRLQRLFIREVLTDGREQVTTAASGQLVRSPDGRSVTLQMRDGQQLSTSAGGRARVLTFESFSLELPLSGAEKLLRPRGGDERELTLSELLKSAGDPNSVIPRATLMAELWARLARTFCLPLLPLLALPLGLSAKRGGRAPGIIIAGLLLLFFQHMLALGQGLAADGKAPALLGVGAPFLVFAGICIGIFASSRKRPGETPVSRLAERIGEVIRRLTPRRRPKAEAAA
ncbi:permease [Phenylobacterium deserti]|uniref:Permease n=1 Tax=Phenylobacterium deserti TaxID=1914756 RepID=A0A328AJH3_9CAUL|nr:permease [Phenylobacterium deserti]